MSAVLNPASLTSAEWLSRLVAFDTTSRNSNLELIGCVADYLASLGARTRVSADPTGRKANLHAVIGPDLPGGVALSGHVDTVPVEGQAWTADPFTLRREHGRLIGRQHYLTKITPRRTRDISS